MYAVQKYLFPLLSGPERSLAHAEEPQHSVHALLRTKACDLQRLQRWQSCCSLTYQTAPTRPQRCHAEDATDWMDRAVVCFLPVTSTRPAKTNLWCTSLGMESRPEAVSPYMWHNWITTVSEYNTCPATGRNLIDWSPFEDPVGRTPVLCPMCGGFGQQTCLNCNGDGTVIPPQLPPWASDAR